MNTEYTQSGNCNFPAYIPSWWKIYPSPVRVGGARPPLSLNLPLSTKLRCMLHLRGQIHSFYFYSTPICTLWIWYLGSEMEHTVSVSISRGSKSDGARGQQGRAANDGVELHKRIRPIISYNSRRQTVVLMKKYGWHWSLDFPLCNYFPMT